MSTTRYKIRLWEYDGEASVANAVTFDSFDEAQARFNDLRVSEEYPLNYCPSCGKRVKNE